MQKIDPVEFLSQYTELTEKNGEWWGLSPLADPPEKTPSFSVRRESGQFYCFSTGVGGSLITFLMHYHHIPYAKAIEMLQSYAGVDGVSFNRREKLAATEVCQRFSKQKPQKQASGGKPLPDNAMERYEDRPDKLYTWVMEGISEESLQKFQVRYDSFSDRLVYPIRDDKGRIVNVGGRTLDPDFKAKGLRKYTYFYNWPEGMGVIYGLYENLHEIRRKQEIILFEGAKSVMLADTYGVHNTGAILTSHLNPMQLRLLVKLGVRVVFALDKDVDIFEDHNIKKLKRYANVEYLFDSTDLLGPKDAPVDRGGEVFLILYQSRRKYR